MTRSRRGSPRSSSWARRTTSRSRRPRTPTQFTDTNLARFQAVIWLSTTGDVLNATQQAAFERYIRAGGGYVGVHAAADTEYDWPWYGNLVGAYFSSHPAIQQAPSGSRTPAHPSTAGLPANWNRTDEWYNYRTNPRAQVHVLANLDEATYTGGGMGGDHPISWCRAYDGGRSWYTGLGPHPGELQRGQLPHPPARRHPVRGAGHRQLLRRLGRPTRRRVQPGDAGQGRGRDRRADGPDRAAQPGRAAHLARRRRPLHRRRRQHQGGADPAGLHARRGGPAEHQGRPELRHQPLGVRLLRATAVARRAATRRPPARRRSSPRSTASTGWPGSPCGPTTRSTRRRR